MIRQFTIAVLIMCSMSTLSALAGTWSDGFEHPDLDEWEIHVQSGNQPVWKIENGLLLGDHSGYSVVWIGDDTWKNYKVEVTVILLKEQPKGAGTPDQCGAGIVTYYRIVPCQGYAYGIVTRHWDGKGAGAFVHVDDGWRAPIVSKHQNMQVEFSREYRLSMTQEEDLIKFYIDDEMLFELTMDRRFTSGAIGLGVMNARAYFDDFVVTGANIPDGGPGLGTTVKPQARLATTWAYIKQQ